MRAWLLAPIALAALGGCVVAQPSPTTLPECAETPTTSKTVAGYTLWGKGADIFLVVGSPERVLHASTPEKMLVVVDHPIIPTNGAERIPNSLNVLGRNLFTGTRESFTVGRHNSELGVGVEWGTNFEFPDAGCWELQLSAPRNADTTIVVRVR